MEIASLEFNQEFKAPLSKLWEAWTNKEEMAQWLSPEGMTCKIDTFDLTIGGTFRIVMTAPDGSVFTAGGAFTEITPMEKLSMSWAWETGDTDESRLTISFAGNEESSSMKFVHDQFKTELAKTKHNEGWASTFRKLEKFVA